MEALGAKEIKAYHDTAANFAKKEIKPDALEYDRFPFADFNRTVVDKLSANEFLAPTLPEALGGAGAGMRVLGAMLEEIAKEDASMAVLILIQSMSYHILAELGTEDMMKRWNILPEKGNPDLLSLPIYSDPEDLPDTIIAVKTKEGYSLKGAITYLPCLPVAKAAIIPARIEGADNRALFIVETDRKGMAISEPIVSLGFRGCPHADLTLDQVVVPEASLLGGEKGEAAFGVIAEKYRGPVSAIALGIIKGACQTAKNYAKERYQGGKQIIEHHMVRKMLSDMVAWIDVISSAAEHACQLSDNKKDPRSRSKLLSIQTIVTSAVTRATTDGVQVLGGYGYMHEYGQEKRMRDAKQLQAVFGSMPLKEMRVIDRDLSTN
ncbi:MAG: acyl-CoA/acyl-ACP dehydrogenase [Proteobacteria bacterium]|nr:acyl-CoA/acyl-ACP dehydrogenase [Pseudomonadota bacterium]